MYYINKAQSRSSSQIVTFIFFLILYCAQMVFAMLFLMDKYVAIMKVLFGIKKDELMFAPIGCHIFSLTGFLLWIPISYYILKAVFSMLFGMNKFFASIDSKENYRGGRYSLGSYERDMALCIVIELAALFFFVFSIFYNIRVRDEGIIHKKFFSLRTELIQWHSVDSLDFCLEIGKSKKESATPKFIVHAGNTSLDLWNGFGIGSPKVEELISFTELLLKKNPAARLNINFELSAKNLSVLKKYKSGEEKIRLLYNYILQKQKSTNVQGEIYGM